MGTRVIVSRGKWPDTFLTGPHDYSALRCPLAGEGLLNMRNKVDTVEGSYLPWSRHGRSDLSTSTEIATLALHGHFGHLCVARLHAYCSAVGGPRRRLPAKAARI